MPRRRSSRENGPLGAAVARIGDRWSLLVVEALLEGPSRFGDLGERVDGIAPNVLTSRLRKLEADGVVRAVPYSQRPLRVEYELTDAGQELAGALALLAAWGRRQGGAGARSDTSSAATHRDCGTRLVTRLWCPTCDRPVDDPREDHLEHL